LSEFTLKGDPVKNEFPEKINLKFTIVLSFMLWTCQEWYNSSVETEIIGASNVMIGYACGWGVVD